MRHVWLLILGVIGTWAAGWIGLTLIPRLQLSTVRPPAGLRPYSDLEQQGRRIYVVNGCLYCHSQQPRAPDFGPDSARGWGRASVPGDYYYDDPHLLGTSRTGPDLLNIGVRQPSADWHLIHLYEPRSVAPASVMPSYRFLFEEKAQATAGDRVVPVPQQWAPPGKVVVATPAALALVAYLKGLDRTYPVERTPGGAHEH